MVSICWLLRWRLSLGSSFLPLVSVSKEMNG
jgi:hypothetical protein